jgi:signal transduction histidine kinase
MKTLIEHLLFLARGDSDTIRLQLENFNVSELLEEVIKEARLIDHNHQYEYESVEPVWIVADKQLIKQVLRILVDNAMKYSLEYEKIILKLAKDNDQIRIVVQDNGIGIKPQDVPHIFDRFYRSDESRDKKTGGSGLGLAIAKSIIEKHGGHFDVVSRVGIGTRITVTLKDEIN